MAHTKTKLFLGLATACTCSGFIIGSVMAFFDEVLILKQELTVWETTHAADFTDIIEQLDDISASVFQDVHESDWFAVYVSNLAEWEIVSGYKDQNGKLTGEYRPGNNVTVAETLKMALEGAQIRIDDCEGASFHPQAEGHWSKQYVLCAENLDVRLFQPDVLAALDRPAGRAEVLTIVHDAFGDNVLPIYSSFIDAKGHAYESDVAYAALTGVVGGDTDDEGNALGVFRPNEPINRAEVAKVIYEKIKQKSRQELAL